MTSLSKLPLLSLPGNVIQRTVRLMNIEGIICLSLVSKRCKHHVISLRMMPYLFEVSIQDNVNIHIESSAYDFISVYLEFPTDETVRAGQKRELKKPHCFTVCRRRDGIELGQWKWTQFEYQDWLEHLWEVFHRRSIARLRFEEDAFLYDLDDIKKVFGKADKLYIEHTGCYDFNQLVFQKFSHIEKIQFNIDIFQNLKFSSNILIQNISQLSILDFNDTFQTMQLDDLLVMNSKSIEFPYLKLSPKNINKFMHLWMKGSNPNLEYLRIACSTDGILNTNEIMKGIKYNEVSKDQKRQFKSCGRGSNVYGGMDIQRMDGTCATIVISRFGNRHVFDMFIWHDHCLFFYDEFLKDFRELQAWLAEMAAVLFNNEDAEVTTFTDSAQKFLEPSSQSMMTFPLLSLPENVIRRTVRMMGIDGIICLSLVSKRCKQHVISLRMRTCSFAVTIQDGVNIYIESIATDFSAFYLEFPTDETVMAGQKKKLKKPHFFTVCRSRDDIELGRWKWTHFEYQDWLGHLWAVFHRRSIAQLRFDEDAFLYDLDDIKKIFGKADELYVEHTRCYDFNQFVFQKFLHIEKIRFNINIFPNSKFSPIILIQNISQLYILDFNDTLQTMELDDLLVMNSKSIEFPHLKLSPKDINKFIKLWIKGSNPKLEYLRIAYSTAETLNTNEIMKGIKYNEVSKDQKRQFKCCGQESTVYGGMDIQRRDGTRATIDIYRDDDWFAFKMSVWHDHCLVFLEDFLKDLRALQAWLAGMAAVLFNNEDAEVTTFTDLAQKFLEPSSQSMMTFPLLSLPENVIRRTVRMMGIDGIIYLSLVSKRCKKHVVSLKMRPWSFEVSIQDNVNIHIEPFGSAFSSFYLEFPSDEIVIAGQKKLKKPHCFTVCRRDGIEVGQWKWTKFEYQDWLEHLLAVFHCSSIDQLRFEEDAFLYDLDDIKKVFGKTNELYIEHTGWYDFSQLVLQKFSHIEIIRFNINIYWETKLSSNILIQNINELNIIGPNRASRTIKLDDLLVMNGKLIEITDLKFSPKVMNKFIKLWMTGSNPRLECLEIDLTDEISDQNAIMKGVKYIEVSKNQMRRFDCCRTQYNFHGGMDIQRKDGTRATINKRGRFIRMTTFTDLAQKFLEPSIQPMMTFPLLSLPKDAILETVRVMDIDGVICLSLVSEKCKQHVISSNVRAISFEVSILGDVNFDIETSTTAFYLDFPSDETVMAGQKRKLKTPHCFAVCLHEEDNIIDLCRWKWTHFEYQDWLEHLRAVFHYYGIDQLHFDDDSFLYDLDDVKKVFGEAYELYVEHTGCYTFNQLVFQKFLHFEKIKFDINIFQDSKISSKILIQNINQITIWDLNETSQTMKLNDLLMNNSKSIETDNLQMSSKDINKFIQLWMKGSNPRLEFLQLGNFTEEIPDENVIMKGIKYTEVSKDQKRKFRCCRKELTVRGGMDIQRMDGTRATIRISQVENKNVFKMFIWHDHCFVGPDKLGEALRKFGEWFDRLCFFFQNSPIRSSSTSSGTWLKILVFRASEDVQRVLEMTLINQFYQMTGRSKNRSTLFATQATDTTMFYSSDSPLWLSR
ncbi:unnamed protein product [Caenorhabditis brenneri]